MAMGMFPWRQIQLLLARALTWTGMQTFASLVATTADIDGGTIDSTTIGGTTPAAGTFSPVITKGPAIITTFAGTVTATASTTVTFSSAADAILAGYSATNPILGTTLISNALTRYIISWTNATTCVVDSNVTWAGTAITSVQLPIATFVDSSGATKGWMNAAGAFYFQGNVGIGTTSSNTKLNVASSDTNQLAIHHINATTDLAYIYQHSNGNFYIQNSSNAQIILSAGSGWIINNALSYQTFQIGGVEKVRINDQGNLGLGMTTFGTSATKALGIGSGTAPTTSPADGAQMWVADYLGGAGDARLHIMGEASAAAKAVLGSGKVGVTGTTGGLTRQLAEATSGALSGASGSIAVNVPSGARILGVQLRVDTAITSDNATKTWAADYVNTPTTAITSGQVFAANTKFNAIHPAYEITTGTVTITITAAAGSFTGGVVRGIVYYESLDAMSSL